jgi:MFS family permease
MRLFGNFVPIPVLVICGAVAASLFGDSMLYAVMPSRPEDWGLSIGLVGILLSANRLVRLVSNSVAAQLFAWFGPRPPFAAAMIVAVLTTASYGWVTTFWVLLLARMAWGVCWSILRLGAWLTVLNEADDANRGFLMGIYSSVARSGSLVGVAAGGVLTDSIGHKWTLTIFAVATAVGGVVWFITSASRQSILAQESRQPEGHVAADGASDTASNREALRTVLRDRQLLSVGLGGMAGMLVFSGLLTASLGFYLDERFGDEIGIGGLAIGVASFTGIALGVRFGIDLILAPVSGRLSDRLGRTPVILTAFGLGAVGLLGLATSPPIGIVVIMVTLAFVSSTALIVLLHARAGDLAPVARRAAVLSVYATFLDLGSALGPLIGLSVGTLGALRWAFVAGAIALLLMAVIYRRVGRGEPVPTAVEVERRISR